MTSTVHRALRWPRLAVAAAVVAASGIAGSSSPAAAAACSSTSGVTVVVDYGGSESIRCTSGDPGSGFDALARAGFSVTRVQQFPSAVCRINGYPASDPCVLMPPSNAYWSYWHAKRGGSWSYSSVGPASSNPAPGSVEGWAFGAGAPPSVAAPPAPTATPSSSSSTSSKPRSTSPSSPTPPASSSPRPSKTSSTPIKKPSKTSSTAPSRTTATATASLASEATTSPTAGSDSAMSPLAAAHTDGGSGRGGLLAGLGLVAALTGAAGVVVWRRRHT